MLKQFITGYGFSYGYADLELATKTKDGILENIQESYDKVYDFIAQAKLPAWNKNAAGIRAFYFKDPDGDVLEILQFPPDKGNPKWHRPTDKLFLGIDHTAIVVGDTDTSLHFYRDRLGLEVVGESENYGTEQEHLNNVFGARLRITSLHAAAREPRGECQIRHSHGR